MLVLQRTVDAELTLAIRAGLPERSSPTPCCQGPLQADTPQAILLGLHLLLLRLAPRPAQRATSHTENLVKTRLSSQPF